MGLKTQDLASRIGLSHYIPFRYHGGMSALRRLRESRELSQQALADLVYPPTSQSQINRLEKGLRRMTHDWAKRLARPLECDWLELLDELPRVSSSEMQLIESLRQLPDYQRDIVTDIVGSLLSKEKGERRKVIEDDAA